MYAHTHQILNPHIKSNYFSQQYDSCLDSQGNDSFIQITSHYSEFKSFINCLQSQLVVPQRGCLLRLTKIWKI